MSIIQTIRDKGARIAVFLIALSLIGFILMDRLSGARGNLFGGGSSTTLGRVNGKNIDQVDFAKKVEVQEKNQQQQGYSGGEAGTQQIVSGLWDREVDEALLKEEFGKLGLAVGSKELNDMLYGAEPHQYVKQFFYGDANTNAYDPARVAQAVSQIKKSNNAEQINQLNQLLAAIETDRFRKI